MKINNFMINRKQRKRILIFLLVPVLAAVLFISEDLTVRIITIALIIIYVAFIIFLRDSLKFKSDLVSEFDERELERRSPSAPAAEEDSSFKIISSNKSPDVITSEDYSPVFREPRTTLKPPDLKEKFEEIVNETAPSELGHDGQFTFVVEKMLTVIKEAYNAHSAIFFWYNRSKDKFTIEKFVSNSKDITKKKFDLEDDIISKIVERGEPELLTDISAAAESDVIRYYSSPQGLKSFVGVPLFYDKQLIAVITVDSKEVDAFGIETIYALGRFVRVITMIIAIFEEKHSDTIAQKRLNGILNLIPPGNKIETEEDLVDSLLKAAGYFLQWDVFSFVYFEPVSKIFKTLKVVNNTSLKYIGEDLDVEINGTLVGKSIVTGIPVRIDETSGEGFKRFSKSEDLSFDGSFLAVPVIYDKQNYGVLCFESLKKNAYTNSDIQFLKSANNIIAFIIYSFSSHNLLKNFIAYDLETRILNTESFKERLNSDLIKINNLKAKGALALIRIDDFLEQESLFEGDPLPKVLAAVTEIISNEMTQLNIFGRIGEKTFGVFFFNNSAKDVYLWAEKLRVKIARQPIAVVSKQSTYTVSIGVAAAANNIDADELIYNADLALQKAIDKGGNSVRNVN